MPSSALRAALPSDAGADPVRAAMRQVHRAIAELRRGGPVLLAPPDGSGLLLVAAETVGARGLAELAAAASATPLLLLAPGRAAALLQRPVATPDAAAEPTLALRLSPGALAPAALRGLADPTAEQLLPRPAAENLVAAPPLAAMALVLVKLARLLPALVAAPVADPATAARLGLLSVAPADVLAYPAAAVASLTAVATAAVPLAGAPDARITAFRAADGGIEHLAILVGDPAGLAAAGGAPLVRLHSECFTGDLLGSLRCDCGPQLQGALRRFAEAGCGVLLYLAQEGRGIGLVNKLRAYALQDQGLDTLDANRALGWGVDERDFRLAATMLESLGIGRVRLLTNNPDKVAALLACGIGVEAREPHSFAPNGTNDGYLATKAARFGHLLG